MNNFFKIGIGAVAGFTLAYFIFRKPKDKVAVGTTHKLSSDEEPGLNLCMYDAGTGEVADEVVLNGDVKVVGERLQGKTKYLLIADLNSKHPRIFVVKKTEFLTKLQNI